MTGAVLSLKTNWLIQQIETNVYSLKWKLFYKTYEVLHASFLICPQLLAISSVFAMGFLPVSMSQIAAIGLYYFYRIIFQSLQHIDFSQLSYSHLGHPFFWPLEKCYRSKR